VRTDYRPAPKLGADSRELLAEAGYDDAAIARMIDAGVTRAG
jgi:crotonobetainyl-CoA:carnitine CoA-transferase CaiB-like acyl-CoA transferase